jgi:hypothetical protein
MTSWRRSVRGWLALAAFLGGLGLPFQSARISGGIDDPSCEQPSVLRPSDHHQAPDGRTRVDDDALHELPLAAGGRRRIDGVESIRRRLADASRPRACCRLHVRSAGRPFRQAFSRTARSLKRDCPCRGHACVARPAEFTVLSRAHGAWGRGVYEELVPPVPGVARARGERDGRRAGVRADDDRHPARPAARKIRRNRRRRSLRPDRRRSSIRTRPSSRISSARRARTR